MKCFKNLHFLSLLVLLQVGWSQVPQGISYQGVLTELSGDVVVDGNYVLTFRLHDAATGGNELWSEIQALVAVTDGIFSVTLGAITELSLPFDQPYWLGVSVGAGEELTPRLQLTSAPYSRTAATAQAVAPGAITTDMLSDSIITGANIVTGAVETAHLAADAVNSGQIVDSTITGADISGSAALNIASLTTSGNVGIGTASPASKLEVAGVIHSTTGGIRFPDGTSMTSAITDTSGGGGSVSNTDLSFVADANADGSGVITFATSGTERIRIENGGNVGIGTSVPTTALDVIGTIRATNYLGDGTGLTAVTAQNADSLGNQVAGAYALDSEILSLVVSVDGAGSGLDADLLDGLEASAFADNTHTHIGSDVTSAVANADSASIAPWSGLTGVPAGFADGVDDSGGDGHSLDAADGSPTDVVFVDAAGNVGIGTTSPAERLVITGDQALGTTKETRLRLEQPASGRGASVFLVSGVVSGGAPYFAIETRTASGPPDYAERMRIDPNGNVGIGKTSPAQILDIAGTAQMTGFKLPTSATSGYVLTSDASGLGTWQAAAGGADGDWTIDADTLYSAADSTVTIKSGKVGIGTTAPEQTLHVHKGSAGSVSAYFNSVAVLENSTSGYLSILTPDANESGIIFGNVTNNSAGGINYNWTNNPNGLTFRVNGNLTKMVIASSGNVGIGTTSPLQRLHVNGTALANVLRLGDTGGNSIYWDMQEEANNDMTFKYGGEKMRITAGGNVGIGTAAPGQKLSVAGTVESTTGGYKFPDGSVQTTAATGGTASGWTDVGTVVQLATTTDSVGIGTTSPSNALSVSGGADFSGKVGIGTTAPDWTLTTKGGIHATGGGLEGTAASIAMTDAASNDWSLMVGGLGTGNLEIWEGLGGGTHRVTFEQGGNVGIGITSPGAPLEVSKSQNGITAIRIDNPSTFPNAASGIEFYMLEGQLAKIAADRASRDLTIQNSISDLNSDILFQTLGSNNRMVIKGSGNVGIGTTSPLGLLHVGADKDATLDSLLVVTSGGNVGIGTTSPSSILHVLGGKSRFESSGKSLHVNPNWANSNTFAFIGTLPGESMPLRLGAQENTSQLVLNTDGNVGIGTTSPGQMLTVADTIESTLGGFMFPDGSVQTTAAAGAAGWSLTGNTGTTDGTNYVGTSDNVALELRVNGVRALRLEPDAISPNVIGGYSGNSVTAGVVAATIGGGGASGVTNRVTDNYSTVAGGRANLAGNNAGTTFDKSYATVGGGDSNTASGDRATVGGGGTNTASGFQTTVSGGFGNTASGLTSTIGGGLGNTTSNSYATVGGGATNTASGDRATVSGGGVNTASGQYAAIGGGGNNRARGLNSVVSGGGGVAAIDSNAALGDYSAVGGGARNKASGVYATVSAGNLNTASGIYTTVGGGRSNIASNDRTTVGGGDGNNASGSNATIGGGNGNTASDQFATVPGGYFNAAGGFSSFAAGYRAKASHAGTFVWADSTNADFASTGEDQFLIRASGGVGIGTTAPDQTLHVHKGSAGSVSAFSNSVAVFENSTNGYLSLLTPDANESGILFGNVTSNVAGSINYNWSSNPNGLTFRANGNLTKMVITSSGNVGIGTTSPDFKLEVAGEVKAVTHFTQKGTTTLANGVTISGLVSPAQLPKGAYIVTFSESGNKSWHNMSLLVIAGNGGAMTTINSVGGNFGWSSSGLFLNNNSGFTLTYHWGVIGISAI